MILPAGHKYMPALQVWFDSILIFFIIIHFLALKNFILTVYGQPTQKKFNLN